MTTKLGIACMCLFAACAPAAAKDLHLSFDSKYDFKFAGQDVGVGEWLKDGGRTGGTYRLFCAEGRESSLFHGGEQIPVEDLSAVVRVTVWMKGHGSGDFGLLAYTGKRRNFYPGGNSAKYAIAAADGWKRFTFDFRPEPGGEYCNKAGFVLPYVSLRRGDEVFLDDFSIEFVPQSGTVKVERGSVGTAGGAPCAAGGAVPPCVPVVAKAPPMTGAFRPQDWSAAVQLGGFVRAQGAGAPAADTRVYLCRSASTLFMAVRMGGEDVRRLAAAQGQDRVRAPWRLSGVECFLGNGENALQLALDYMGRVYSNVDRKFYSSAAWDEKALAVRVAVPLEAVPREAGSDLMTRMNFYRKASDGVSCWSPNPGGNFTDLSRLAPVWLDTAEKVAADVKARADAKAALVARGAALKAKYGRAGRIVPAADFSVPEPKWLPAKFFGRDWWYALPVFESQWKLYEETGLTETPLLKEALLWIWWERNTASLTNESSFVAKLVRSRPQSAVAVKGMDRVRLSEEERKRPDILAYWDKAYADKFLSLYAEDGRFAGFWEDEAFVSGTGYFADYLKQYGLPKPKTREEAYGCFRRFYEMTFDAPPPLAPFRNVANASPYFHGYVANSAAGNFNHFTSAFGDPISGNETGDCMTANPPKFAIARGAARQWGRPWRNYQTYYQWTYVGSRKSGGARCITGDRRLLKPECSYQQYGFNNGPDRGTDLARQKNTYLYPYMCGCGFWSSEANLDEIYSWYDPEEVKSADPLCVVLRDMKPHVSEMMKIHLRFYDEIVKKRDRGVSVTPFGIVWDRANGYCPIYFGDAVWDFFAPTELEQTMWAFNRHVFRNYEDNNSYSTSAYGDLFDIFTNDAADDFLATYPILMPIGDVTLDTAFAAKLVRYVEQGGTLVVNAALLAKYPGALKPGFLGATFADATATSDGTYSRLGGRLIMEDAPYAYRALAPAEGTEVLAVTADASETPVVVEHRVGKGRVILTGPENMKVKGSSTTMLRIFDDLLGRLRNEVLPIRVKADENVQYAVNRSKASWLVYFNNNNGIPKNHGVYKTPPVTDVTKRAGAKVAIPKSLARISRAFDWWTGREIPLRTKSAQGEDWTLAEVDLAGGDCAVVEFVVEGAQSRYGKDD